VLERSVQAELLAERPVAGVNKLLVHAATSGFPPIGLAEIGGPQLFGNVFDAVAAALTDWNSKTLAALPVQFTPLRVPVVLTSADTLSAVAMDAAAFRTWSALPPTGAGFVPLTGTFHLSRVGFDPARTVALAAIERRPTPNQATGEFALFVRRPEGWRKLRTLLRWG
jgi:hypothetical protein